MGLCGNLSKSFLIDCLNPLIGGTEDKMWVINREQIAGVTRNPLKPNQVTALIPAMEDIKGGMYVGINSSVKPKVELVRKEYSAKYNHTVDFIVFAKGAEVKAELEVMAQGRYVVIIQNTDRKAGFEIFGLDVGLELKSLVSDPNDDANDGAYVLQLGSPEKSKEGRMPSEFLMTTIEDTAAYLLTVGY